MEEDKLTRVIPNGHSVDVLYLTGADPRNQVWISKSQVDFLRSNNSQFDPVNVTEHGRAIEIEFPQYREGSAVYGWVDNDGFKINSCSVLLSGTLQQYERLWQLVVKRSRFIDDMCKGCEK